MSESKIGLGYTAEGLRVVARVEVEQPVVGKALTFTDHVERHAPARVSVWFEVSDPTKRGDARWVQFGQVGPEDRVIVRRHSSDATEETAAFIQTLWADWHLNDMHAACDHMTEEMLTPSPETLAEYVKTADRGEWREKYSPAFYGERDAIQKWRLDNVVCPETGYRYGHAWLAREVPADILRRAERLAAWS